MNKVIAITGIILSISIFSYSFYKSEIILNGSYRDEYIFYYILSFIVFFLSITVFFLSEKITIYLLISCISIVISFYSFETYLMLNDSSPKLENKVEFLEKLKKNDKDIVVTVYPSENILKKNNILPLSGVSNSKTIFCNENDHYSIYKSDRYGFNNPDEEWEKQNIEYLLVGDSFTHGACVDRPYDIASNLRTFSKKSALNLGYAGNGPLLELATLKEYMRKGVKNIIWIYYENDFHELKTELGSEMLLQYLEKPNFTQSLKTKQNEIDFMLRNDIKFLHDMKKKYREIEVIEDNKFFQFLTISKLRNLIHRRFISDKVDRINYDDLNFNNPYIKKKFINILNLAMQISKENNSNFYFVYLPGYKNYQSDKNSDQLKINKKVKVIQDMVESLGITFINIHLHVFMKENDPLDFFPFRRPGHYTMEGYKTVSEAIYSKTK